MWATVTSTVWWLWIPPTRRSCRASTCSQRDWPGKPPPLTALSSSFYQDFTSWSSSPAQINLINCPGHWVRLDFRFVCRSLLKPEKHFNIVQASSVHGRYVHRGAWRGFRKASAALWGGGTSGHTGHAESEGRPWPEEPDESWEDSAAGRAVTSPSGGSWVNSSEVPSVKSGHEQVMFS